MKLHVVFSLTTLFVLVGTVLSNSCSTVDGPVTCDACKEGADINALDGIPRFSRSGASVSSNLGEYDPLFVCSEGSNPTCEATEVSADDVTGGSGAASSNIIAWAENLAVYAAFAWILAIVFALYACTTIVLRRCCCCCCGRAGTCGQTEPTRKGDGCYKLGFQVFPIPTSGVDGGSFRGGVAPAGKDGELLGPLAQEQLALSRVRYPTHSRWGSRICLGLYVFFVIVFVIIGNEKGNFALTEAQKSVAAAPTGIMQSIQSMTAPLESMLIAFGDRVAASTLQRINSTVTSAVDVRLLAADTQCLRTGLATERLPDPSAGDKFVANLTRQVENVNSTLDALSGNLDDLEQALVNATGVLDALSGDFEAINASAPQIQDELAVLDVAFANLSSTTAVITSPSSGASATADDVDALSPQPDQALASSTSTRLTTDISGANDDGDAGTPAWASRNTTWSNLLQLEAEFAGFPDLDQLADDLEALNAAQTELARSDGAFGDAEGALATINSVTAGLPAASSLNASLLNLRDVLLDLPVPAVLSALEAVNSSLVLVPAFSILEREVRALQEVVQTAQCAESAQARVQRLNATVIQVPDVLQDLNGTVVELNETRASTEQAVADAREQARNVTRDTADVQEDITATHAEVSLAFNDTRPENVDIDFDEVQVRLQAYGDAQTAVNGSSSGVLDTLAAARPALSSAAAQAPAGFIADLRAAAALFTSTKTQVAATQAAYATWHASGRCSSDHSVCVYDNAASCSVGSCLSGLRLCSTTFPTVACTADSDCGGDTCLYVDASFVTGRDQLATYGAAPALSPAPAGLATALRASDTAVAGMNFTAARTAVGTLQATLVALDPAGVVADLNETRGQIQPDSLGVPAARADVQTARGEVQFDFADLAASSADLNATLADIADLRDTISQVDDGVDELVVFLYDPSGLQNATTRLQSERLRQVARDEGTSGLLLDMSRTLDDTIQSLNRIYAGITADGNGSALIDTSVEGELRSSNALDRVDAVSSDRYSKYGPYHFLAALQTPPDEACSSDAFVCAVDPETTPTDGGGVFRDENGRLWNEDRKCITLQCINNQIDEWNKGPLTDSADFSDLLPLAVSRESAMFLPYLIPLLMVLVAALPLCIWKGATWQRWPMCLSTWCIAICTPIIFAIIGGLLFPLVIAGHDVCRGGANAAYTAAAAYPSGFCESVVGGTFNSSSQLCELSLLGDSNPVELDVAGSIGATLGDCDRFPSVFGQVYESLEDSARDTPVEETNAFIEDSQGSDGAVRPRLAADLRAGAGNASAVAVDFVTAMETRLGCTAVNDRGLAPFKEAMCCGVMDSFYWLVASWYLIGFTMCLCGWPASLLGYKRLPNALWGDAFEDVFEEELATQLQNASAVAKRRRRSSAASGWVTAAGAAAAAEALQEEEDAKAAAPAAEHSAPKAKAVPLAAAPVALDTDEEDGEGGWPQEGGGAPANPVLHEAASPPNHTHQGGWTSAPASPMAQAGAAGGLSGHEDAGHDPSPRDTSAFSDFQTAPGSDVQAAAPLTGAMEDHVAAAAPGSEAGSAAGSEDHVAAAAPGSEAGSAAGSEDHVTALPALVQAAHREDSSTDDQDRALHMQGGDVDAEAPHDGAEAGGGHDDHGGALGGGYPTLADEDFGDGDTAPTESSLGFGFEGTSSGGGVGVSSWGGSLRPGDSSLPPLPTGGVTGSPSQR